jgi:NAD(P)-dependent dehydrogenase (short-subunit alcohol dehydrogenase family)
LAGDKHEVIGLARTAPADFPDPAAAAETLDTVLGDGTVDAVVNNVGIARFGRIGTGGPFAGAHSAAASRHTHRDRPRDHHVAA